jgi:hypothetical protein
VKVSPTTCYLVPKISDTQAVPVALDRWRCWPASLAAPPVWRRLWPCVFNGGLRHGAQTREHFYFFSSQRCSTGLNGCPCELGSVNDSNRTLATPCGADHGPQHPCVRVRSQGATGSVGVWAFKLSGHWQLPGARSQRVAQVRCMCFLGVTMAEGYLWQCRDEHQLHGQPPPDTTGSKPTVSAMLPVGCSLHQRCLLVARQAVVAVKAAALTRDAVAHAAVGALNVFHIGVHRRDDLSVRVQELVAGQ